MTNRRSVLKSVLCAGALAMASMPGFAFADELETLTSKAYWPFPSYGDLLFGVR